MTHDPVVEPDPPPVAPLPAAVPLHPGVQEGAFRGQRTGGGVREEPSGSLTSTDGKLLKTLRQLVDKDAAEWPSAKGPVKGVRWKTGQPPAPPAWKYDRDDLRA